MISDITTWPTTLQVKHSSNDNSLICTHPLRKLPGKRLVCNGFWQGQRVVVKLFLHRTRSQQHLDREKIGLLALHKARIKSPEILFSGALTDETPVLISEELTAPKTALDVWNDQQTDHDRKIVLRELLREIAGHHNAGLYQKDLHLGNFLYCQEHWYSIDGDTFAIGTSSQPLSYRPSLANLALFFAQLEPQFDQLVPAVIDDYLELRKLDSQRLKRDLESHIFLARKKRRLAYVKKSFRTCSEFVRSKNNGQVMVARRDADPELIQLLASDPDAMMAGGKMLKHGNSSTVVQITHKQRKWVVKRYNIKNFLHGLKRCLRPTRAAISWGNAQRLRISAIATPLALAMIEKRFGPIRLSAYYICEYNAGQDAAKYFCAMESAKKLNNTVAENFVTLFDTLKHSGIYHGDCKATNFLISNSQPLVIDLDAMREFRSQQQYLRHYQIDRARFLRNWKPNSELWRWFDSYLPR